MLGRIRDDVGDDPHAGLGRVDVGVADHELLEDVVLDGSGQLLGSHALLLGRHDVGREHREHGAVHGHGDADLAKRNTVEEALHVLHGVDGDARLANVAAYPRMIAVVAPVGGEVEGDGKPFLAGQEIAPIEGVTLLGGGEARVLPDRPRPVGEHGGAHAPRVGREARQPRLVLQRLQVGCGIERLDLDALGRLPREPGRVAALELAGGQSLPVGDGFVGGIGHAAGLSLSRALGVRLPDCATPRAPCVTAIWRVILPL